MNNKKSSRNKNHLFSVPKLSTVKNPDECIYKKIDRLPFKINRKVEKEIIIHSNFQQIRDKAIEFSDIVKLLKRKRSASILQ